jgi:hypothetical protein
MIKGMLVTKSGRARAQVVALQVAADGLPICVVVRLDL